MRRSIPWVGVGLLCALCQAFAQEVPEPDKITYSYACMAVDCRKLAGCLGGGIIVRDPIAAQMEALARWRHNPRGFLTAGYAPIYGDGFGQGGAGIGPGGGGADDDGLSPWIPEGLDPPIALVEQNTLLLRGTQEAIDEALELLRLIDKPAPMVRIDLKAISSPEEFDSGRNLMWRTIGSDTTLGGSAGSGGGGLRFSWALGDLGLALDQFETQSRGYGEEDLFIVTESGIPAYVGVRYVEPSFLPERAYDRSGNIITTYNVVYNVVETSLYVLPQVNGNGTVTMFLSPFFSGKVGEVTPPGGTAFPIIQTHALNTIVTVADGQTVAIGGFKRIVLGDTYQGQGPIEASDLPRWRRSLQVEDVTLFVTPRIIDQDPASDPIAKIEL
jgi:hypothetical protein